MNAIVSVTRDWGIGLKGALLVRNKADMHRFVELTMGGTVLMGRKTLESFPGGPLKGRRNVVLSRDPLYSPEGAECYRCVDDALAAVAAEDPDKVWLIGGASIYAALIDECTKADVTKNDVVLPADAFFPNLDSSSSWHVQKVEPGGTTKSGIAFDFVTYSHQ